MDEVTAHFSITRINTFTVRRASRLQLAVFTLHKRWKQFSVAVTTAKLQLNIYRKNRYDTRTTGTYGSLTTGICCLHRQNISKCNMYQNNQDGKKNQLNLTVIKKSLSVFHTHRLAVTAYHITLNTNVIQGT